MKKLEILTITNNGMHFGNRLQNYALQEALKKCGADVETIRSAKSVKGSLILSKIRRLVKTLAKNSKRRQIYTDFENRYIKYDSKVRYENVNENEFAERYDAFVAGSDQVWNPNFHFNSDFEFASFAPKEKRFSYAASIGVSDIKAEHRDDFIKNLKGMNKISVREADSVELVKRLAGVDADFHIDPTVLLDADNYRAMEQKPDYGMPDRYLFMYYLGNVSEEYQKKIEDIASEHNLKIIKFTEDKDAPFYNIGPQHFLYLIDHADYICTDSFHGTIFSILFHKKFAIFTRQDSDVPMNSRIETLVDTFGVRNRLIGNLQKDYFDDIDYENVEKIVKDKREEAYRYLKGICD